MARAESVQRDEASAGREILVALDRDDGETLRAALQRELKDAIHQGRLKAGARLPSSRGLSNDLGVSRGVVSDTYDQLASEGYLRIAPRSAPSVAPVATGATRVDVEERRPSFRYDFRATTPDVSLFPRTTWGRAVAAALKDAPDAALDYGDPRGQRALRAALAEYLGRVRGVRTEPQRMLITQGALQATHLLSLVLVARGVRRVAFEDPSWFDQRNAATLAGVEVVGCPVDGSGIRVDELEDLDVGAVVVTPAHQFPTGAVMAPHRRRQLLEWARRTGGLIIEDDYDAEFRYDRAPVGALEGLDPDRVAHLGTASKTLSPALRLGWVSLPRDLIGLATRIKETMDQGSPAIPQLALAHLITTGAFERHINKARREYRARRNALRSALTERLAGYPVGGIAAGLHLVLLLPHSSDEGKVIADAATRGMRLRGLGDYRMGNRGNSGLVLGYGRMPASRVGEAVALLADVLRRR